MSDGPPPPPPPDPTRPLPPPWAAPAPPAPPSPWATPPAPGYDQGYGYGAPPPGPYGYVDPRKSKLVAGLLAFFVGTLGVHNFYLGYTGKAVAQLLITVLTCGLGSIVTGIWAIVEGIMILTGSIATDANGVPLKD